MTSMYLGSGIRAAARSASANAAASRQRRSSGGGEEDEDGGWGCRRRRRGGVDNDDDGADSVSPFVVAIFERGSRFWLCSSSISSSLRCCCGEDDGLERELSRLWGVLS